MGIERREFLKRAGLLGGIAAATLAFPGCRRVLGEYGPTLGGQGMLERPATESGIDHVVVVMMENRSFDHWLGWLAEDHDYLEAGRSRYGAQFSVDGQQHLTYAGASGPIPTKPLVGNVFIPTPYQGCGHLDPGHSWLQGRAQRDNGFLATGTHNDELATGYYVAANLPFTSEFARSFVTFDRYHASVLGPTYPNRGYLHSAQSGGRKDNSAPPATGYPWETIWTRLSRAGVPAKYYYSDLPFLAFWGAPVQQFQHGATDYFTDCAAGTLPNVSFLDPKFTGPEQNDDHPLTDIRRGQAFLRDAFRAFAESPHWHNGLFVVTYDEWGGFFDHVAPPHFIDDRASATDRADFSQAGFRVPTMMASPFAKAGFVDHRPYEHTSILRFLEWRFLGAPPEGPGSAGATWFLTSRDRNANNLGASLQATRATDDIGFDTDLPIPPPAPPCVSGLSAQSMASDPDSDGMQAALESGIFERLGAKVLT